MKTGGIATVFPPRVPLKASQTVWNHKRAKTKREGIVLDFWNHPCAALKSDSESLDWIFFFLFLFSGFPDIKCWVSCLVLNVFFLKTRSKVAHSVHKESALFPTILPLTWRWQTAVQWSGLVRSGPVRVQAACVQIRGVPSTCQTSQYLFSPAGVMTPCRSVPWSEGCCCCCSGSTHRVGGTVGAGRCRSTTTTRHYVLASCFPPQGQRKQKPPAQQPLLQGWTGRSDKLLKVQSSCQIQFFLKSWSWSHHSNVWSKGFPPPPSQFGFSQFGCFVCLFYILSKKQKICNIFSPPSTSPRASRRWCSSAKLLLV